MSLLGLLSVPELVLAVVVLVLVRLYVQRRKDCSRLPPGPRGWPFIGNLFLLMKPNKQKVFRELQQEYGDLVSLPVGGKVIVLVGGRDTIHRLFSERSSELEHRPQVFTVVKVGQGKAVINSSGAIWKEHRSFLQIHLKDLGVGKTCFEDNVLVELQHFLDFLDSVKGLDFDPRYCIQTATTNIICSISFGQRFDYSDPNLKDILNIVETNMRLSASTSIVNYFPFLEYLPGDLFQCAEALENLQTVHKMLQVWINRHRENLDPTKTRDIIDRYLLQMDENTKKNVTTTMDDSNLRKLVGDLFVAGSETTATTLRWALLYLVRHPEVQARIYREVTLQGRSQLSIMDKKNMHYTSAFIFETLRLGDIAPFSLPHSNSEPMEVDGYIIPAGSIIMPNIHSLHSDPNTWDQPEQFCPERFLDSEGQLTNQKLIMPFSIGSRDCPGRNLAMMELFLFITSMVTRFELLPSSSEGLPSTAGQLGVVHVPGPFSVRFVRRDTGQLPASP